ncbi:4'-phosphopantetheinyl transferase family protein [Streptomyces sp. NPDC057877]|uniref:4'-phosphopantetheinyl transferase family protein n=1 Tax=Streptomyces sp. NPDC057877 TaxID=3346269 RepID=UPI0036810757
MTGGTVTDVREALLRPRPLVRGPGLTPPELGPGPLLWAVRAPQDGPPLDVSVLDEGERRRAEALRRPAERALYVAAHTALRRVLGAYVGLPAASVPLTRLPCPGCGGPHGRPAVARPYDAGVHFSLAHTDGLALLGLAAGPVGVDVERVPGARLAADGARSLHPRERAELAGLPSAARPAAFARCWTRKEALVKATGDGLSGAVLRDRYVGTGARPAGQPGWTVVDVCVPAGWAAACVVPEALSARPAVPRARRTAPCASRGSRGRR